MAKCSRTGGKKELSSTDCYALGDFQRKADDAMLRLWPAMWWRSPRMDDALPLCDTVDRGDKYELQVEMMPGVEKDTINIKACRGIIIEISGKHSEKSVEKAKDHVYNERPHRSLYRKIPVPDEIEPSKVSTKMSNGILTVVIPKKNPVKSATRKVVAAVK
ncbi:MAG: Hsp20/alpha crystallin family protein [Nitrososphaera sp.]